MLYVHHTSPTYPPLLHLYTRLPLLTLHVYFGICSVQHWMPLALKLLNLGFSLFIDRLSLSLVKSKKISLRNLM